MYLAQSIHSHWHLSLNSLRILGVVVTPLSSLLKEVIPFSIDLLINRIYSRFFKESFIEI